MYHECPPVRMGWIYRLVDKSTVGRLVAGAAALVLALSVPSASPAVAGARPRLDESVLTCESCLLVDDSGRTLFARRATRRLPNASTTKMATAIVVVEAAAPSDVVTVSPTAAAAGGGGLDLDPGDRATVEDLLAALLLSSSNDAAVALAEHVAGTEDAFVARMNVLASDLGALGTRFATSHGLDRPGHFSTARDLALFGWAVLDDPLLASLVGTPRTVIDVSGRREAVENRNLLLEAYPGAVGIKTGFTAGAGNVLVAAARRTGRTLLGVAMRSGDPVSDARTLLDFGFAVVARGVVLGVDRPVGALVFGGGSTPVVAARRVRGPQRPDGVAVRLSGRARAPVVPGEIVGEIVLSVRRRNIGRVAAVASGAVEDDVMPPAIAVLVALVRALADVVGRAA